MVSAPAILEFGLVDGQNVDAVVAARALIDWVEAIREVARIVDPTGEVTVDLISAEPACLRFSTILNFIEQQILGKVSDKLDPFPKLKQFLALNVLVLPGMIVGGLVVEGLKSDDPRVVEKQEEVVSSPVVQARVRSFYKTLQADPAIKNVVVRESRSGPAVVNVDRSEFAERSGLWEAQEVDLPEKEGGGVWDVVVTHPVAIAKPLMWGFMRDGLPFRAKMMDERFLSAIRFGTLPLTIQEGVVMQVRVSYRERLEGQLWVPVQGTYKIEEVITPKP